MTKLKTFLLRLVNPLAVAGFALAFIHPVTVEAQFGALGGGSALNRGGDRPGQRGGMPVEFTFYGAVLGNYSKGLAPVVVDQQGRIQNLSLYGGSVEGGLSGSRTWSRSVLGVDWRGDYRKYSRSAASNVSGTDQALAIYWSSQPSRRWIYQLSTSGLTSNRAVGGFIAPSFTRTDLTGLPLNDIFNNRVYALQGNAAVTYQRSARTSFSFYGSGYMARRAQRSLFGTNGYGAGASYNYIPAPRTTIGILYNYWHYSFPRAFGASDLHSIAATYSKRLTREWSVDAFAGVTRVETLGAAQVTLDPEVAEILGVRTGVQAVYRINYAPYLSLSAGYRVSRRTACTVAFNYTVAPGNGLFLTSRTNTESVGCSTSLPRKASFSFNGGRTSYTSLVQTNFGRFTSWQGGMGFNYVIRPHVNFTSQIDARTFSITRGSSRTAYTASIGLAYTPSELPLPRW